MRIQANVPNWVGGYSYCRKLMKEGLEEDDVLEVWRGHMPCYKINSIFAGSKLCIKDDNRGVPRVVKYSPSTLYPIVQD
jgi:hypothetical protein